MSSIEQAAYACMDAYNCGSDLDLSSTLSCLSSSCEQEYCTFFTRYNNALYSLPACLVSRNADYAAFVSKCAAYQPTLDDGQVAIATSAASFSSFSLSLALFGATAAFFF
jgi:hypothetical protein